MAKALNGEGKYTPLGAGANLIAELSRLAGLPAATVKRDILAFARSFAVGMEDWRFQYQMERALSSVVYTQNRKEFYDIAFGALSDGDLDTYRMIREDLMGQDVKASSIESAMRERLKKKQEEDPSFSMDQSAMDEIRIVEQYSSEDEEKEETFGAEDLSPEQYRSYSSQRAKAYREWADTVQAYSGFSRLEDEDKDRVLSSLEQLAEDVALRDNSGGEFTDEDFSTWGRWATGGERYGVSETEAVLFRLAYDMAESDVDRNGKTISGSKKENTLEEAERLMPWLTEEELDYLMANFWTPRDRELKELKENKFMQ